MAQGERSSRMGPRGPLATPSFHPRAQHTAHRRSRVTPTTSLPGPPSPHRVSTRGRLAHSSSSGLGYSSAGSASLPLACSGPASPGPVPYHLAPKRKCTAPPGLPLPSSVGRAHSARPGAPAKPREAIATRVTAYCVQLLCPRITQGALTSAPPGNGTAVLTRTHSASPSRPDGYVHTTPLGPCPGTRPPRSLQNALSLYSRMPSLST